MKVLFDTILNKVLAYPRADFGDIVGLDPMLKVLDVVQEDMPDLLEGQQAKSKTTIDVENGKLIHGYEIIDVPPPDPMEVAREKAQKRLAFYQQMLAQINAENDLAGFNSTQIQACMTLLMPIKQALEVGIVEGSMYMLSQIEPTPEYNAERKGLHLTMFQEFLDTL